MKNCLALLGILILSASIGYGQTREDENYSLSYDETIAAYEALDLEHETAELTEWGTTDVGKPLHLFVINSSGNTNPENFEEEKAVLLINNGIHPGEPCGVDASVRFANDLLNDKKLSKEMENVIVCIIPIYNVGGSLNRGCCSRANQNGPSEYGFRGNARNLDLNRDFVKRDSENARSFSKIFHATSPDYFIDTHTSNGADYQYTMTMLTTQPSKLTKPLVNHVIDKVNPAVYEDMESKGWGMIPYVHMMGRIPEEGIKDYYESPRYSTGYASLFNAIGFTSETHMLKPFKDRVESTYQFEVTLLSYMNENFEEVIQMKEKADDYLMEQKRVRVEMGAGHQLIRCNPF